MKWRLLRAMEANEESRGDSKAEEIKCAGVDMVGGVKKMGSGKNA